MTTMSDWLLTAIGHLFSRVITYLVAKPLGA